VAFLIVEIGHFYALIANSLLTLPPRSRIFSVSVPRRALRTLLEIVGINVYMYEN
jgi:hypothetical protein